MRLCVSFAVVSAAATKARRRDTPQHSHCLLSNDEKLALSLRKQVFDMVNSHYDAKYWKWQGQGVDLGGKITALLYEQYASSESTCVDFGCGSGTVLQNLKCKKKLGIEVNPHAQEGARNRSINVVSTVAEVPDGFADLIVSNHALEHTPYPLETLAHLRKKIRSRGKLVLCVPGLIDEKNYHEAHKHDDPNVDQHNHLYAWSPRNLANLLVAAGYQVASAKEIRYSRTYESDQAFLSGGADAFWKVAEQQNVHPQTCAVAEVPL